VRIDMQRARVGWHLGCAGATGVFIATKIKLPRFIQRIAICLADPGSFCEMSRGLVSRFPVRLIDIKKGQGRVQVQGSRAAEEGLCAMSPPGSLLHPNK